MAVNTPWETPTAVPVASFSRLRRRVIFEHGKWDPQLEDRGALASFPIVLKASAWNDIADIARRLYDETLALEAAVRSAPRLWRQICIPRRIRRALRSAPEAPPSLARVMRFDFHFTTDGWRISEVNSDVPGGFIEAGGFSSLMAEHFPEFCTVGDPADILVESIARKCLGGEPIGLVHATAYTDDRQVMNYLGRKLAARGFAPLLISPAGLSWKDGVAYLLDSKRVSLAGLVRFFPAEWLPNLRGDTQWEYFFSGSRTPQSNPGTAILTQSKRLPLVWKELATNAPVWHEYLPECRDRRSVDHLQSDWVLKPALGRIGEGIAMQGVTSELELRPIVRWSRWQPKHWIAQRRFAAVPMPSPDGPVFPCIGVFVIDGRVAGAYGRIAHRPLVDDKAQDAAVLYCDEGGMMGAQLRSVG